MWPCAGCTLVAKKPTMESARASLRESVGHRPKRLPRKGRIAVFSVSGEPSSSLRAGTRPSGWIFMYSGVRCSPLDRSMRFASYFSPDSSSTMWEAMEHAEEHTSELQSPCNLVCRLLLEKKKK